MIVTFSGMNGAGKTTFARALVARLTEQGVNVTYRPEFTYNVLKPILGLRARHTPSGREYKDSRRQRGVALHQGNVRPSLALRMLPYPVLLDFYLAWAYLSLGPRNRVTVVDRTTWEYLVFFEYNRALFSTLAPLFASFPRGGPAFHVSAPPEVAHSRRSPGTYDLEAFRFFASRYEDLLVRHPKAILDGTDDVDRQIVGVCQSVLEQLKHQGAAHGGDGT